MRTRNQTAVLLCILAVACSIEQPNRYYETYENAVSAGEIERGWLPQWIPDSASKIHVVGDLDTNETWLRFEIPGNTKRELENQLVALSDDQVSTLEIRSPRSSSWWFEGLIINEPANDAAMNANVYKASINPEHTGAILFIERASNTVFVWIPRL